MKASKKLSANFFASVCIRNDGNGKFSVHRLPPEAQFSAVNGMVVDDFNADGNLDVVLNTNDFSTEPANGRYDALNGLLLEGRGDGSFTAMSIAQSGIFIPGNGKALVKLKSRNNDYLLAASQNRGALELFSLNSRSTLLSINRSDVSAEISFPGNKKQLQLFDNGSSFLSQSAPFIVVPPGATSVRILNRNGKVRELIK